MSAAYEAHKVPKASNHVVEHLGQDQICIGSAREQSHAVTVVRGMVNDQKLCILVGKDGPRMVKCA